MEARGFQVGDHVRVSPSEIEGVVYAVAPGVVYVKLAKGEVITSPPGMLDYIGVLCDMCHRYHTPLQGHFGVLERL